MTSSRIWRGIRMRDTEAGMDPDATLRAVTLPAAWDDQAAAALAELAPGLGRTTLAKAADAWIRPIATRAWAAGYPALADRLHALLLHRRAAPTSPVWQGAAGTAPGFVLNLAAFHTDTGFDSQAFVEAIDIASVALRLIEPAASRYAMALADLDGLIAALGLDYASPEARAVAACLFALLRARADIALAGDQPDLLSCLPSWPAPPDSTVLPGLASLARAARTVALGRSAGIPTTAVLSPGPADALLGIEVGGIAPAFSPLRADGGLSRASFARLAARGMTAEAALARHLAGDIVLAPASAASHQAMHDAVAPFVHAMPARPPATTSHPPPVSRELPARRRGFTQKASVGGHRLYLRTGEYADGSLGEISISLPRGNPALRGLMDGFAAAVSLGLQHGVALHEYVTTFTLTRFAPAGPVDGDPAVQQATSLLDYVFRTLAIAYLGHCNVPEAEPDESLHPDSAPLLPMDLPTLPRARRLGLRLVHAGYHTKEHAA